MNRFIKLLLAVAENKRHMVRLRIINNITAVKLVALAVLMAAFSATALAQCGASFTSLAAAASIAQPKDSTRSISPLLPQAQTTASSDNQAVNTSIVGLWHIRFLVGDQQIQEAFQIWNTGGTEVHNPNVDPRQGSVCLGTWREAAPQTFRLAHRVWLYDTSGNFQGIGDLTETLTLGDRGNTHSGTFTLDIRDPAGNLVAEVPGTVVGERITP